MKNFSKSRIFNSNKNSFPNGIIIICGNSKNIPIQNESIQLVVTSPPYWGLRRYETNNKEQIGLEDNVQTYVKNIVKVFREIKRILKPNGVVYLNIGDTYASRTKGSGGTGEKSKLQLTNKGSRFDPIKLDLKKSNLKPKDLCLVPSRVALALQKDGWYIRQDIIWYKNNPVPEPVIDRFTRSHEYIFLLSKKPKYYFNALAVRQKIKIKEKINKNNIKNHGNIKLRLRKDVWKLPSSKYKDAHFATFSPKLVKICILSASRPGDIVFDPFGGSGTVAEIAHQLKRKSISMDISWFYSNEITRRRLMKNF